MPSSLRSPYDVKVPHELAARLEPLFRLKRAPRSTRDLARLVCEKWLKDLEYPEIAASLKAIVSGKETFGRVDYATNHVVKLPGGKEVQVACALDAIIEGFFRPIRIESRCPHCQKTLLLRMSQGKISSAEPKSPVLWFGASSGSGNAPRDECSCEKDCCPYINLFASQEHLVAWRGENPEELGMALTLKQTLWLAREGWWKPIRSVGASRPRLGRESRPYLIPLNS